jgi:SagB-type dehydrogenase family enzyme
MKELSQKDFRYFLKDLVRMTIDFSRTDQSQGKTPPPLEKPFDAGAKRIALVPFGEWQGIHAVHLETAIRNRVSHRQYKEQPLTLDELSFLLWATQGIKKKVNPATALRFVPSAGSRHALETYLCVLNVTGLEPGIYRYLPLEHELLFEFSEPNLPEKLSQAAHGQAFTGKSAVTFIWTTIPYRMEWRYDAASAKVIAMDSGHVCQNLYLCCECIGAGTCAIAAYDQELMDKLVRVDGTDEFVIYLAPVGKV